LFIESPHISEPTAVGAALVALVGNPNTGKTTLFNELTGYRQRVGNYPGVTVEKKTGRLAAEGGVAAPIEVIDLPGTYGFAARSQDEGVVIDVLTGRETGRRPDLVVVVLDAVNLRRNLFLASQILELGIPVVAALNMIDLAETHGLFVDPEALAAALGVTVVPIIASKGQGIAELKHAIVKALGSAPPSNYPRMPATIQCELEGLRGALQGCAAGADRGLAGASQIELLQVLLEPGGYGEQRLCDQLSRGCSGRGWGRRRRHRHGHRHAVLPDDWAGDLAARRARLHAAGIDPAQVEAEVRYRWIEEVMTRAVDVRAMPAGSRSDAVDRYVTHPVWGLALLVLIVGAVFQSIYAWAAPVMDLIDEVFHILGAWVAGLVSSPPLQSLLVNGVVGGVGAVMVFLPQIMILFLFLAILEDCGYMARAAFLLDRVMGFCGLNGKAFIPLISSFACAVPGIMSTRTIENRADRFIAILVAPLMSCSARLPVYVLLIGAFVPPRPLLGGVVGLQTMVLIAMYFIGIIVAVAVIVLLRRVVFKGESRAFLMELPSYKWPSPKTVLYRVYERAREFVVRAGTIIVAVSILIWALGYYPRPAAVAAQFAAERAQVHAEAQAARASVAADLSAADAAARRDALAQEVQRRLARIDRDEAGATLRQSWLGRIGHTLEPAVKPLGWDWRIGTAVVASFPAREVVIATLGTIYNLGEGGDDTAGLRQALQSAQWPDGRPVFNLPVALGIMVFFALCMQCAGTLAVIKRETNSWRWPGAAFAYMTTLAYFASWGTYRLGMWLL
jgi:ferrous iron transport protein B